LQIGVVVGGAHLGMTMARRREIIQKIHVTAESHSYTNENPLLVMTQGADSFESILEDLEMGVDLIHSNYPLRLTKRGCAFNPAEAIEVIAIKQQPREVKEEEKEEGKEEEEEEGKEEEEEKETENKVEEEEQPNVGGKGKRKRKRQEGNSSNKNNNNNSNKSGKPQKRPKKDPNSESAKTDNTNKSNNDEEEEKLAPIQRDTTPFDSYSINLWDEKYRKDRSPLVRKKELLFPVILF
jgi:type IV secretory pathway VirB10-like protein